MDLCPKENDRLCLLAEPVVFESCFRLGLGKSPLALAGFRPVIAALRNTRRFASAAAKIVKLRTRSEEHTSELQSLMRISYAVFCLKKKNKEQIERIALLAPTIV